MKKFIYSILFTCFLILTGCPYDSKVELNTYEESFKVEKEYFGNWTAFHEDGSKDELQVEKGMKTVYNVRHYPYDEKGKKQEYNYYRAYMTEIGGVRIANVEKKDGTYNFYRYTLKNPNELVLESVKDDYMKANFVGYAEPTTEKLRAFIEENIKNEKMYDDPLRFVKEGSDEYHRAKADAERGTKF